MPQTTTSPPKLRHFLLGAVALYKPAAEQRFDPAGPWKHAYVLLNSATEPIQAKRGKAPAAVAQGYLTLERRPEDGDTFTLRGEFLADRQYLGASRMTFQARCRADRLASTLSWKVSTVSLKGDGKEEPMSKLDFEGSIKDNKAPATNWGLMEAVQRLGNKPIDPVTFDMLEDFDALRPGQRRTYWGTTEATRGGRPLKLTGYQQIGQGILPYHYWLDESGRLVLAYGALQGFVFNPDAQSIHAKSDRRGA